MKRQIIIPLALSFLCSCGNNNAGSNKESKQEKKESKRNIVRQPLRLLGDFTQITSLGGIDIVYTQGSYNCEIEGDSASISHVRADVESGILTMYFTSDNNPEMLCYENKQSITAYISTPDLNCVALCSTGNFSTTSKWKQDNIELGIIGTGSFNLDSIECNTFKYEATGDGDATFKHIDSKGSIMFTCMSKSNVKADINTDLIVATTQSGEINLTGKAKKKDISATNRAHIKDNTK